jgi:uncharacterized alkaline shock family protein YloU
MAQEPFGTIDISPSAVSTIVDRAVHECYGVVGMANKSLTGGIAHVLSRDSHKGIDVSIRTDGIIIDIYVIVQYGTRIRAVAESIQNTVTYHVEQALNTPVQAVNVYIQGMRLNEE